MPFPLPSLRPAASGRLPRLIVALALMAGSPALAADGVLGIVAPVSGAFAPLGAEVVAGASAGFADKPDTPAPVVVAEPCAEGTGKTVAEQLIAAKVSIAVGFLCTETLEEALPLLTEAGIPALSVGVRSAPLMDAALKNNWSFYRIAPAPGSDLESLKQIVTEEWAGLGVAIVDDGLIPQRELAEALGLAMTERGQRPVFTDTFRPGQDRQVALIRRIVKAGATHVFVAADRADMAIIARDALAENAGLSFLGGPSLDAADDAVPLAVGVKALILPDYAALPQNHNLVKALRLKGIEPDGYVLPAYAAGQIARATLASLQDGQALATNLAQQVVQTVIGTISFTERHERADNPWVLMEWNGKAFVEPKALTP